VDADKSTPGIQELKEWQGVIEYVQSFKDTSGDGIPDFPEKYKGKLGRIVIKPSWHPAALVSRATLPTIMALLIIGLISFAVIYFVIRITKERKKRYGRLKFK
jgi:hypothetical protein